MNRTFIKKPIHVLMADSEKGGLKRTLGRTSLILLGIGAIIGAGLFVRTAAASAEAAGPAVTMSFLIASIGCAFAGICYAEFSSMFPIAGSAYTYAYATMGELVAWVIGWALIMEYALGAATVAIAWSEYLNHLLGFTIPYQWCHSPFETSVDGISGIINLPALSILLLLTLLLIKGTQESAMVNGIIVFIKVAIVLVFIVIGFQYINADNYVPYIIPEGTPGHEGFFAHGYGGILRGAAIVFFAFIGFDAVSTAAQEAKNPQKDMPWGILGSLVICTILYVLFAHVLTGVANWQEYKIAGKEASVVYAIQHHMPGYEWLGTLVTIAILAGFSSVILVMLMGQSRVFFSMSNDGLIPPIFAQLHSKFKTPYKSNWILFLFVGAFAAFIPGNIAGDLTSFGTLLAFILVCIGVMVLRKSNPELKRPFKTPLVPLIPLLGVAVCSFMIISLDHTTQIVALFWMLLGFTIYFSYGFSKSKLQIERKASKKSNPPS